MISAKVKLVSIIPYQLGTEDETAVLSFYADYDDERNKEWSLYTPALNLTMHVKGSVVKNFKQGQAYTLTFEENNE